MTNIKIQLRGNCPCCGREHAVVNGTMSKHGYTVDNGWFEGVCSGQQFAPMQQQREVTDRIIEQVRLDVVKLNKEAEEYETGVRIPEQCNASKGRVERLVAWDDAPEWLQADTVKRLVCSKQSRARAGTSYAQVMEDLLNSVHGQPLREVTPTPPPVQIMYGEVRDSNRGPLTVVSIQGARIHWVDSKGFKGYKSSVAWRQLDMLKEG